MMSDGAMTVMATTVAGRRLDDADEVTREGRRGIVVVALLVLLPSPGGYSAPNPTVGIGALRIAPCRAVGHVRSHSNPPIPVVGDGLTDGKGTPRITKVVMPGGVGLVTRILLLIPTPAPVSVAVRVGQVASTSTTRIGTAEVVVKRTARRGLGRRVLGERWSDVRHRPDVPLIHNTPVRVSRAVTMLVAGNITTRMMIVKTTTEMVSPAGVHGQVVLAQGGVDALGDDRKVESGVVEVAAVGTGDVSDGTLVVGCTRNLQQRNPQDILRKVKKRHDGGPPIATQEETPNGSRITHERAPKGSGRDPKNNVARYIEMPCNRPSRVCDKASSQDPAGMDRTMRKSDRATEKTSSFPKHKTTIT